MPTGTPTLTTALESITVHDHLCLIYETREEQFAAVVPFIHRGLATGERCVYIADDNTVEDVVTALRDDGIDTRAEVRRGALQVLDKRESYLRDGTFDPDAMIAFLAAAERAAGEDGFTALRVTGEMTWVLGGEPGTERLFEYEARLNRFFPGHDALAICQYNRARFSPDVMLDVIRAHPLVIFGERVCENPYYVPPDEFLLPEGSERQVERMLDALDQMSHTRSALEEASRQWTATFDALNDAVCLLARDGTVLRCNRGMTDLLGLEAADVVGRKCYELVHEARAFFEGCPYQAMLRTGRRESTELELGESWYQVTTDPMLGAEGDIVGAVHVVRDVSDRRRGEERIRVLNAELELRVRERTRELTSVNRQLQELVYSVAHDLRTPLRAIDGFSLAVSERAGGDLDEDSLRDLERVRAASQRLGRVLDGMVTLSSAGRRNPRVEPTDVSALAAQVDGELRARQPERLVEMTIEEGLTAVTDPLLAEIVLANLLDNAWKSTSRRPVAHIEVGAVVRDGRPSFYVRDDGVGFDPAFSRKLFSPFESLHDPSEFPGTGVGLATVARTLEILGGTCWAEGRPGEGATFYFVLSDAAALE
jgi:PAS domain S-box-containing protein